MPGGPCWFCPQNPVSPETAERPRGLPGLRLLQFSSSRPPSPAPPPPAGAGGQIRPRRLSVCLAELVHLLQVKPCGGRGKGPSCTPSLDPHKLAAELEAERWPRARGTAAA